MVSPRWRKVLRDLQQNSTQSALVIGAIVLGIFSVTWVSVSYSILARELHDNYMVTNPASAVLYTDRVTAEQIQAIEARPDIAQAEAAGKVSARVWVNHEWKTLELFTRQDFETSRINHLEPEDGIYPPPDGEIVLERLALAVVEAEIGDNIRVQIPGLPEQTLRIAGTLHDISLSPAWQEGLVYGYVTSPTLTKLGLTPALNEIRLIVKGDTSDKAYIRQIALETADWLEEQGQPIYRVQVPTPNEHPLQNQMEGALLLLTALGTLALLLSAVLVANMIAAFLAGQIRQIAVMRAIGANLHQVVGMYFGTVFLLSATAAVIAMPLGIVVGRSIANFIAFMLNFNIASYHISHPVYLLQVLVGLGIPLLAAAYPIYKGTRLTVREALNDYGVSQTAFGENRFDRLLANINGLARPLLLSIRNTFRQRGRLLLTFSTLAMGGAIFMAALNVRASMFKTIDVRYEGLHYDLSLSFDQPYPMDELESTAKTLPEVIQAEAWGRGSAEIINPDGTAGDSFIVLAPPTDTQLITPALMEGQWLSQANGIVLNHNLLAEYPALQAGDEIRLNLNNQPSLWQIVGITREPFAPPLAYVSYPDFPHISGRTEDAESLYLVTNVHDEAALKGIKQQLETAFAARDMRITTNQNSFERREIMENHALLITSFLMLATFMSLIVGGLGLMTTMSINILERTREIGVMRAIGASNRALLKIILTEGLLIGVISWLLAAALVLPISYLLSQSLGQAIMKTPLNFALSATGFVAWLLVVVIFSVIASLPPAWNATRLTVRNVLAYE